MTHDGTINTIACGTEPIVVGSFNTAVSYKSIDGATYGIKDVFYGTKFGNKTGNISFFSSYGKLADNRVLPHVCAPGMMLISSFSHYTENCHIRQPLHHRQLFYKGWRRKPGW